MKSTINLLYISACDITRGGVQKCIESWIRNINNIDDYNIYWFCTGKIINKEYYEELQKLDVNIICGNIDISSKKRYIGYYKKVKEIVQKYNIDVIHTNTGMIGEVFLSALIGNKLKVKAIISHSHNDMRQFDNVIKVIVKKPIMHYINKYSTHKLACSKAAVISMFGEINDYQIINNGIDIDKFVANRTNEIKEKYTILNVGALNDQKNQLFLIDVINELYKIRKDFELWIVGEGPLRYLIEERIKNNNLENVVKLLGERNNVNELMKKSNLFVLPSIHEGLPIVLVEAQTAGLKIIASSIITREIAITPLINYLPLEKKQWVTEIDKCLNKHININDFTNNIIEAGYDIKDATNSLRKIYEEIRN